MYYWDHPIKKISKARSAPIHKVENDKTNEKKESTSTSSTSTNFSTRNEEISDDEEDEEEDDLMSSSNAVTRDYDEESEEEVDLENKLAQDLLGMSKKSRQRHSLLSQDTSTEENFFVELPASPMNEIRGEFRKSILNVISMMLTQNITKFELRAIFDFLYQLINKDPQPCLEVC